MAVIENPPFTGRKRNPFLNIAGNSHRPRGTQWLREKDMVANATKNSNYKLSHETHESPVLMISSLPDPVPMSITIGTDTLHRSAES